MSVLLIDDGLRDWSGHNAAYALSVLDELRRRGIASELFANENISRLGNHRTHIVPAFRNFAAGMFFEWRQFPSSVNRIARFLRANWSHLVDLCRKVSPHVEPEDVILVLIASTRTTVAYALWLRWLSVRRQRLKVVFIVHNRPHGLFRWEARFLEIAATGHRIVWAAHTEPVVAACSDAVGHQSFLLPLPFGANGAQQIFSPTAHSPVLFSYLGVAGFPKGLDILVEAIGKIEDLLSSGVLRLVIQCNIHMQNRALEELHRKLEELARRIPNIEVIAQPLTPTEYQNRMSEADLVLIPHRREFYRFALSGIFTEALSMGKPVIAASDTHMAEQLQRFGSGICFEDGSVCDFARAMRTAMCNIEDLRARAFEASSEWRGIHNAERYVTELCAMVNID